MASSPPPFPPLPSYSFPTSRLYALKNPAKIPLVLVACGSFSPVTYLHLRMFEMAKDYVRQNTDFEIVGGYLSPVSDMYRKPGLLSATHRLNMLSLATNADNEGSDNTPTVLDPSSNMTDWLSVDPWEALQTYQRTAVVLDHFEWELNGLRGGVPVANENFDTADQERRPVRIMLLAGSDLISTMSEPGVWSYADLDHILSLYGTLIVERAGSAMDQATDALAKWRNNIHLISQLIQNDVSSTKVRLFIRRGLSVRYLLPASVVEYIEREGLYLEDSAASAGSSSSNAHASRTPYVKEAPSPAPILGGTVGQRADAAAMENDKNDKK